MMLLARLMLAAFLAAFAATSVGHAAGSGEMAAAMVLSDDAMETSDCVIPCGESDAGGLAVVCDIECGTGGVVALLAGQAHGVFQEPQEIFALPIAQTSNGLTGPPAKQPPRTLI